MNQVKEILRLRWAQRRTVREVARALGISVGVVQKVTNRARDAGVTWEELAELDEAAVNVRLYGPKISSSRVLRPEPDPVEIHKGLMSKGVTLQLLHLEYLEAHPQGLRYTAFCDRYRAWKKKRGVTMRQVHKAGHCAFVDFSGGKPGYTDRKTGEQVEVEFFVSTPRTSPTRRPSSRRAPRRSCA